MEFTVVECADRRFEDVCAQLRTEPAVALQLAADGQPPELRVDAGSVSVVGSEMAVVRADWRDGAAQPWLETELRVVGVNRGAEPTTELVLVGRSTSAATERACAVVWARALLAELADHPWSLEHATRFGEL